MGNIEIEFEELNEDLEVSFADEIEIPKGFDESKNALKNVANEHGGEITDETPFADYAPEFDRVIKSKAESVTAELEKTQAELTETQGKLTATENELTETQSTLEATRGELAEAIAAQITEIPLTVTENGTYTANEKEAFNPVTVDIKEEGTEIYRMCATLRKLRTENLSKTSRPSWERTFADMSGLTEITEEDFPFEFGTGFINFQYMFYYCVNLTKVPLIDTAHPYNTGNVGIRDMFNNCQKLKVVPAYDFRHSTAAQMIFNNMKAVEEIWVKNIGFTLQVASGSSYGHLLKVESLIHLIYQLRDMGAARTLTIGNANLEKLANVYVRPVEITDEMRENDDLIDEKLPFEVCGSTDEGATPIVSYAKLKNWNIA